MHLIPESARGSALTTAALWGMVVLLVTGQAEGALALGDGATQLIVYWVLACACTLFWCTFMRVGRELVDVDWHVAYELDPGAILAPGRDPDLERALAHGLAADRSPDFWPARTWRAFTRIGATFWAISALATVALAAGWLPLRYPQRGMLLAIVLVPAVQCTAAGVIGPGLTRLLELREVAREARRRLCAQGVRPQRSESGGRRIERADWPTVPIHVRALRAMDSARTSARLHVVDNAAPYRRRG